MVYVATGVDLQLGFVSWFREAGGRLRVRPWPEGLEDVQIFRHRNLCAAIPFPKLSWADKNNESTNLERLHDYAVQLANSAIDWYIHKKFIKKRFSRSLHVLSYLFAILGALVPLFKIFSPEVESKILHSIGLAADHGSIAVEAALVLIGVAGGFNLIDRFAGFTNDWMRYMATAMRLNQELIEFQFRWSELERAASTNPSPPDPPGKRAIKEIDPIKSKIDMVHKFCSRVLSIVEEETSAWADELKNNVAQFTQHIMTQHGRNTGKK